MPAAAPSVCDPATAWGTVKEVGTERSVGDPVDAEKGRPTPSHDNVTLEVAGKPEPLTESVLDPTVAPDVVARVMMVCVVVMVVGVTGDVVP